MKIVPLSEAKSKLSRYGKLCRNEPVVVTVNGRPSFQLVPLEEGDDLLDQLLQEHPGFRRLLQARMTEPTVSAASMAKRLAATTASGTGSYRKTR